MIGGGGGGGGGKSARWWSVSGSLYPSRSPASSLAIPEPP